VNNRWLYRGPVLSPSVTRVIGRGSSPWLRIGATAVAAVVVAEAAAWLLRPRDVIEPVHADEGAFFTQGEIAEARDYRSGQRLIFVGSLAAEGVLLVLLASGRPAPVRRGLERLGERPALGGAAAAAGLSVAVAVVTLPFGIAAHERSVDVGLSTQGIGDWAVDWLKATGIGAVLAGAVGTAALALIRRFGGRWWIPGSVAVVAAAAVFTWLAPVVLEPVFNKFEKLEPGKARDDVLELGDKAGIDIGEVYRVDASRRSTAINAYVNGLGPSKRVVLYDTLLNDLNRSERRSVIAHELAHVHGHDIRRGLLFLAIVTPLSLIAAFGLAGAIARRGGGEPGRPDFLPALAIGIAVVSFAVGVAGNQLSRRVEARADTFALQLTDDPKGLIELQEELTKRNISDPDPPAVVRFLLGTHPTTMQRIGEALAWEQGQRP
jgi:Zn-dependent protease with chaperone function